MLKGLEVSLEVIIVCCFLYLAYCLLLKGDEVAFKIQYLTNCCDR